MVFVKIPSIGTRVGAWGLPALSAAQIGENLRAALKKSRDATLKLAGPTTGKYPIDRLRRSIAHAMCMDVVFAKKMKVVVKPDHRYPNSRVVKGYLEESPVWKCAPKGAYKKANRLSWLFSALAVRGWVYPNNTVVHDLVRLAIYGWHMPLRHFNGVVNTVIAKLAKSSVTGHFDRSSPDPLLRFGALSNNPILTDRVFRSHRKDVVKSTLGVSRRPNTLALAIRLVVLSKRVDPQARAR